MNNNIEIERIVMAFSEADKILLFPHISLDGDCLGSSMAICHALRKLGKKSFILLEDEIPDYLNFISKDEYVTYDMNIFSKQDISISIDCGDDNRFPKRAETYHNGKKTICIDHHITKKLKHDINYIDSNASATGQMIFHLIGAMEKYFDKSLFDKFCAEAIYVAIAKDTGNFTYTNTTKETHLIVASLFDFGIDLEKIGIELYQSINIEKIRLTNEVMKTLDMFCNNKANLAYLTQDMLLKMGALRYESEGLIDKLRELKDVEISAFIKEKENGKFKVSLRSKTYADVQAISIKFGGGGHRKAAGFEISGTIEEIIRTVKEEICANMEL